jgi:hypothetical protein
MDQATTMKELEFFRRVQKDAAVQAEARGDQEGALRCRERARLAKRGKFLEGDVELRDPNFCMENQALRTAAYQHGLVTAMPLAPKE